MIFNFSFGDIKVVLGIIAGLIALSAYLVYVISIFRGGSKPNRATWWIWSFMGLILALSYQFSGASNTIWVPYVEFLGPLIIAILSINSFSIINACPPLFFMLYLRQWMH